MPTYVHKCPDHGQFEEKRLMADSAKLAACPQCGQECGKVFCFDPNTQLHFPNKFRTNFGTTGFLSNYGGGEWENHVRDFHKWDSDFAGQLPGADLPAEQR